MENLYDYKKFAVLYVDDEEKSLKYFERAFGDDFRVLTAATAQDGFKLLQKHADEIGLLLTDQRMPGEKGVWLLERARASCGSSSPPTRISTPPSPPSTPARFTNTSASRGTRRSWS